MFGPFNYLWKHARLYLFHRLIQNFFQIALLDPNHKWCRTADCTEKFLWNHWDVCMGPSKWVKKSSSRVNALGEGAERKPILQCKILNNILKLRSVSVWFINTLGMFIISLFKYIATTVLKN